MAILSRRVIRRNYCLAIRVFDYRSVPAGEWSHSQSGTSFAYFLVVVATNILRYSGIQQGALALTSNALWPAPLPRKRSMRWDRRVLPLGWGRRRRARSLPEPRACGTVPMTAVSHPCMLGRAPRAVPRKSRCAGQGCRVALVRGKEQLLFKSSGRSPPLGERSSPGSHFGGLRRGSPSHTDPAV